MPITAFIGVRISWLIVARKALLASLAASASRRARQVVAGHQRIRLNDGKQRHTRLGPERLREPAQLVGVAR